jgi:hypothetical protein
MAVYTLHNDAVSVTEATDGTGSFSAVFRAVRTWILPQRQTNPVHILAYRPTSLRSMFHPSMPLHVVTKTSHIGFEVLTAMVKNSSVFWNKTPCGPLKANRRFGGICRLHLQGRKINRAIPICYLFRAGFLRGSFVDPEDGGDMFFQNVG